MIHTHHTEGAGRPRAGHHPDRLVRQRAAVVDESDAAAHGHHDRRAPRHADTATTRTRARRRPRCREPHPEQHDRRGGHPPRPRGDLDHRLRLAEVGARGETIVRTWQTAHVMKQLGPGPGRPTTRARRYVAIMIRPPSRTGSPPTSAPSRSASWPTRPGIPGLRRAPARRREGRDRLGAARRRQRLDPDPATGLRPSDVRRSRRAAPRRRLVRRGGCRRGRLHERFGLRRTEGDRRHAGCVRAPPENDARPDIRVEPDTFRVWIDGDEVEPALAAVLPMVQRYFLF